MRNNQWITTITEGNMEGKAGSGRLRTQFPNRLQKTQKKVKTNYKELKLMVIDNDEWRTIKVIEPI